jgi:phenylpyruvate tautomerase PptA (4-oxalocrotonate tautomerase family)
LSRAKAAAVSCLQVGKAIEEEKENLIHELSRAKAAAVSCLQVGKTIEEEKENHIHEVSMAKAIFFLFLYCFTYL